MSAAASTHAPAYLLDANILLRHTDATSAQHATARGALATLAGRGARLCIVAQSLFEFWAVATRPPESNGLGLAPVDVARHLADFQTTLEYLPEAPLLGEWSRIVTAYGVIGKPSHDARLVAAMKVHGLTHLLTFNGAHFRRFEASEGITVVDPARA